MIEEGKRKRKVRSDKKVDVKPTMSVTLKKQLNDFARICDEPVKDVAEQLCVKGATSEFIIENIRQWFRKDYHRPHTITRGFIERPRLKITYQGETDKVTIKFVQKDYDLLSDLARALDINPTATSSVLIKMTLSNRNFMHEYIQLYLNHLDQQKISEIKRLLDL
ncbi:hypothetical protein PVJ1_00041 [Psychrobacillus phage PVJ1]|nr:hypothetical protein PVJ1_00041 [Psychrobacillus phage PVJ1]